MGLNLPNWLLDCFVPPCLRIKWGFAVKLIIHMQTFQHVHWLKTCQLIPYSVKSWNWGQKFETECKKLKLYSLKSKSQEHNSYCFQVTFLTQKEYKCSIILEKGFKSLKKVLEEKAQLLQQHSKGKHLSWLAMTQNIYNFCFYITNKGKMTGLKSGFQKQLWKCEWEAHKNNFKKSYAAVCRKDGEDLSVIALM